MTHQPRKRFGQHFLADPGTVAKIVAAINPQPGDRMLEIGPGLGVLTRPLAERVGCLHAVEIDRDLAAHLSETFPHERLVVHVGDALKFDFAALGPGLRVVGNLPYNISTPLLFRLADVAATLVDLHLMLQREVVDRMAARPSTPQYGRLSVMLQYRFRIEKLFAVPPGAFRPPPRVDSAVVRLTPLSQPQPEARDVRMLGNVVTRAFTRRRKTLRNALSGMVDEALLASLEIEPGLRPENLAVADYVRISNRVSEATVRTPSSR